MHRRPVSARRSPLKAGLTILAVVATVLVVEPPRLASAETTAETTTETVRLEGDPASSPSAGSSPPSVDDVEGRRGVIRDGASFDLMGITVTEIPDDPILVRTRTDGTWGEWMDFEFVAASPQGAEADHEAGLHSEPLWMGNADAYELDAPAEIPFLDVHLVGEDVEPAELTLSPARAGAAGAPSINARSAWGARPPRSTPQYSTELKLAIVHHSAGGNTYAAGDVPAVLRSVQAYHQDVQGWSDIAYNFAVDRFGRTWEARAGGIAEIVLGGHSAGFNTSSVGIVVLGEFSSASVPSAVTEAIANLIAWKFAIHHVDPASTVAYTTVTGSAKYQPGTTVTLPRIVGHRDVQATECPGDRLYDTFGSLRTRTSQLWPAQRALIQGSDTVGVSRGTDVFFTNDPAGGAATQLSFGLPGDRVVVGDWDGDGIDTLGVRRGASFILTNEPGGSGPYTTFRYGHATDTPLVGDWDGNGSDTIGIHRNGVFHLRNTNNGGVAHHTFFYGKATDVPLAGDWDANGTDTPGIHRNGVFHLRNTNNGGVAHHTFIYGKATDIPLAGDWDANGTDTPGIRRGTTFFLRNVNNGGVAQIVVPFGVASDVAITGDWDGV